jgi:hypothetical protein
MVGPLVDAYGRKRACIVYCALEVLINYIEHFPSFTLLAVGRVLGGISTCLLFSAFECWMVAQHRAESNERPEAFSNDPLEFPEALLSSTFSIAAIGNGILAVLAGVVAQVAADALGEIGPFQVAITLTLFAGVSIAFLWPENFGQTVYAEGRPVPGFSGALRAVRADPNMLQLGLAYSLFEGAMYTFGMLSSNRFLILRSVPLGADPSVRSGDRGFPHRNCLLESYDVRCARGKALRHAPAERDRGGHHHRGITRLGDVHALCQPRKPLPSSFPVTRTHVVPR